MADSGRSRAQVERRLRQAWRKERRYNHTQGLLHVAVWVACLLVLDLLVDWLFLRRLDKVGGGRTFAVTAGHVLLLAINVGTVLWIAWFRWLRHLRRFDPVRLALQVEKRHPELRSLLVSFVQIGATGGDAHGVSGQLVAAMQRQATAAVGGMNFREIISYREIRRLFVFSAAVLLAFALMSVRWSDYLGVMLVRLAGGDASYPSQTRIVGVSGDITVKQGAAVTLFADADKKGLVPREGQVFIRAADGGRYDWLPMTRGAGERFACVVPDAAADMVYYVRLGDAESAEHRVTVVPAPRIVAELAVRPPAYTGLGERAQKELSLNVLRDSDLRWQVRCQPAIRAATLRIDGGQDVPMEVSAGGTVATLVLPAKQTFRYSFRWVNLNHGFEYDDVSHMITVTPDKEPEVELVRPSANSLGTVDRAVRLEFTARDDYGLSKAFLVLQPGDGDKRRIELGRITGPTIRVGADPARPVYVKLKDCLGDLKVGQTVDLWIEVSDKLSDNDDHCGRSSTRRVNIVSDTDWARWFADELAKQREELVQLHSQEQESKTRVEELVAAQPATASRPASSPASGPAAEGETP